MITLMTIFYVFLFPVNEPTKTACQGKLKKLNYTYDFNFVDNGCNPNITFPNEIDAKINENISMINCFKQVLNEDRSDTKVLLISIGFLKEPAKNELEDFNYRMYRVRKQQMGWRYELPQDKVFFKIVSNISKNSKIELIDKDSPILIGATKDESYKFYLKQK